MNEQERRMSGEERTKHIDALSRDSDVFSASIPSRPLIMQQASKIALGLAVEVDIADMRPSTRADYLAILGGVRDAMLERDAVEKCIAIMINPYGIME